MLGVRCHGLHRPAPGTVRQGLLKRHAAFAPAGILRYIGDAAGAGRIERDRSARRRNQTSLLGELDIPCQHDRINRGRLNAKWANSPLSANGPPVWVCPQCGQPTRDDRFHGIVN